MDGDKPAFAKEIENKADDIKDKLKHVETEEKIKLPTQEGCHFSVMPHSHTDIASGKCVPY
ncbi:5066_t:CDS:2 [Cetraspora pellucida]|uniref:5066_t:CDS:1 n=1 Tax=Cetraspora pellucida TaxID=1433469 RepID=A0A9N8WFW3_9GLOM|nr:5066_t:CDS:2 [Cetraspora pellucida]